MSQLYQKNPESQQESPGKVLRRKKYKRRRMTVNDGAPVVPHPTERFKHRMVHHFQDMTKAELAVAGVLIELRSQSWIVCPSQQTIATLSGVHRDTVSVALKKWERLGLVSNNYRHLKSSLYNIAGIFWDKTFIRKFKRWLPALLLLLMHSTSIKAGAKGTLQAENPTQTSNINIYSLYKRDEMDRCYSKRGTYPKFHPSYLNHIHNLILKGAVVNEVREAIGEITEIQLTNIGKAKLAVFPAGVIREAHKKLVEQVVHGKINTTVNPFAVLMRKCMDLAPTVDTSRNNPTFKALQEKHGFSPSDPCLESPRVTIPERAKTSSSSGSHGYSRAKKQMQSVSPNRPAVGDPLLWEHVNAYNIRVYGRPYAPGNSGPCTTRSRQMMEEQEEHLTAASEKGLYLEHASESVAEICDRWERYKLDPKNVGTGYAEVGLSSTGGFGDGFLEGGLKEMIIQHFKLKGTFKYVKEIIFNTPVPDSVKRGTIITENKYYGLLEIIHNELYNEEKTRI